MAKEEGCVAKYRETWWLNRGMNGEVDECMGCKWRKGGWLIRGMKD
jgi:hypothetical protein